MLTLVWAVANLIINPIALYYFLSNANSDMFLPSLGWIIVSSLAESNARSVVFTTLSWLIGFALTGVGALGIIGFIVVAILFSAIATIVLAIVLVALWIYALVILVTLVQAIRSDN